MAHFSRLNAPKNRVNMCKCIPRDWRKQAELCRRLAQGTTDRVFARKLLDLAEEFEHEAKEADDDART